MATLSLQLGTYVCFPKLYWKAIFGKLILIFHLNLSMTLGEGKDPAYGCAYQYPAWSRHLPWDLEAFMEYAALGSVCVHEGVHACMDAAWARGVCVGAWAILAWPCKALRWLRGIFHPCRQQAWADHSCHCRQREAAQIKGSGVCLCHTLISTFWACDLSIIKCQGLGWKRGDYLTQAPPLRSGDTKPQRGYCYSWEYKMETDLRILWADKTISALKAKQKSSLFHEGK